MDYSWDEAVSNLCHGANVYRFVTIDTGVVGNTSNNASKCATVAGCGGLSYGTESRGSSPENVAGCGKSHVKCWAWAWFVCSWPWRLWPYHWGITTATVTVRHDTGSDRYSNLTVVVTATFTVLLPILQPSLFQFSWSQCTYHAVKFSLLLVCSFPKFHWSIADYSSHCSA